MSLRPGTKYFGSSRNDTGAEFLEFVASTDDVALVELTGDTMRLWIGEDAHELELLSRPAVDTTVSFSDTGWVNASTGGVGSSSERIDLIPTMTGSTTSGVTITVGNAQAGEPGWHAGDDNISTDWDSEAFDTGNNWLRVDFGAGNTKRVRFHTIRATASAGDLSRTPSSWIVQSSNDAATWTDEVTVTGETGWATSEKRTFQDTGWSDTGANARRYWRWQGKENRRIEISELELFGDTGGSAITQAFFSSGQLTMNPRSIGAIAKVKKRVIVSDTGTEHSLDIVVARGPVTLRVGSTDGDDDYISEASLGTGHHNLAFTPLGNFWITLQNDDPVDRIVSSLTISDSGVVEVATPWDASNLADVRYDQSADVVFAAPDVLPVKLRRPR